MYAGGNSERVVGIALAGPFWTGPKPWQTNPKGKEKALAEARKAFARAIALCCGRSWHCPGDGRTKLQPGKGFARQLWWSRRPGWGGSRFHCKMDSIIFPSKLSSWKSDNRGWNLGSWLIVQSLTLPGWTRFTLAHQHEHLSFADGHADSHKWRGPAILEGKNSAKELKFGQTAKTDANRNTFGIKYGYAHKRSAQFEEKWARIGFRP